MTVVFVGVKRRRIELKASFDRPGPWVGRKSEHAIEASSLLVSRCWVPGVCVRSRGSPNRQQLQVVFLLFKLESE